MAVDPNVYALSIQLALEASSAFSTLDDFGVRVTDLEEKVSSAAQKAIQDISSIASEAKQVFVDIGNQLKTITDDTLHISTNLGDVTKQIKDQYDTGQEQLKDLKEKFKIEEDLSKLYEDREKAWIEHLELETEFLKMLEQITHAVKLKNEGHKEQNKLLENDNNLLSESHTLFQLIGLDIDDNDKKATKYKITWGMIWNWIKKSEEATEKFTTTNYRHYGSQQMLLQGARDLAMANGLTAEQAIEAYAVMGNLKAPREELDKYAKSIALANRGTGVGIKAIGEYTNRLRTAGMSQVQTERQLAHMTETMRRFGLNTRDVNALMNQTAGNAKTAARIFGNVGFGKWEEARQIMAGFAKGAGHSAEEMAQFEHYLLNDITAIERFRSATGTAETGVDGMRIAMARHGMEMFKQNEQWEAMVNSGRMTASELINSQQTMIETYYGGSRAAYEAAIAQGRFATQSGIVINSVADADRVFQHLAGTLENQNAEANYTFIRQWTELTNKISTAFAAIGAFLGDALLPLIYGINEAAAAIGKAWSAFQKWGDEVATQYPWLGKVGRGLKMIAGLAIMGVLAFGFFSVVLAKLGIAVRLFGGGVVGMFTSLGKGLQALGNAVRSVMVPLLVLGATMVLVGAGTWLLAQAFLAIASAGSQAIPVMITFAAVVTTMMAVLVNLAKVAANPKVAAGLIVLSITLLAVAVSALLMGYAIKLAADGVVAMAAVMTPKLAAGLFLLALGVSAMALAGMYAGPGLLLMALGLVAIAGAAVVMAYALKIVVGILNELNADALPGFAQTFLDSGVKFFEGALLWAAGGIALAAGIIIIGASLLALGTLGAGFGASALAIGIGLAILIGAFAAFAAFAFALRASAAVFKEGADLLVAGVAGVVDAGQNLGPAADTIKDSGQKMVEGSGLLVQAGSNMVLAGSSLITGAALLGTAGMVLAAGLFLLSDKSGEVQAIGTRFAEGGAGMVAGARNLQQAAGMLRGSAGEIEGSFDALSVAMDKAQAVADKIGPAGYGILSGASGLRAGAFVLFTVGLDLQMAVGTMGPAADGLLVAAGKLAAASSMVKAAGQDLLGGVMGLAIGARMLLVASDDIFSASLRIIIIAPAYLDAMGDIRIGAAWFAAATRDLSDGAGRIGGVSQQIAAAAPVLLEGSITLSQAAGHLVDAGVSLRPAALAIFSGLIWLEFALSRFAKTSEDVNKIGTSMLKLATAFMMLHNTPLKGLRELAAESLDAIPNIEKLGDGLTSAAAKLDRGVTAFEGPAGRLNTVLANLVETIRAFGQGLGLAESVGNMANMLETYADLLESASTRIETAVAARAMPAMQAAERAGLEETVRSEAITTVQVVNHRDGESREVNSRAEEAMEKMVEGIDTLIKKVEDLGGAKDANEILQLLQAYLPNIGKGDSGLGSELNSWSR